MKYIVNACILYRCILASGLRTAVAMSVFDVK